MFFIFRKLDEWLFGADRKKTKPLVIKPNEWKSRRISFNPPKVSEWICPNCNSVWADWAGAWSECETELITLNKCQNCVGDDDRGGD